LPFVTRRRFFQIAAGVAVTGVVALGEDTILLEPNRPIVRSIEVTFARLPAAFDGFTIAQLSDFHYDEYFSATPIRAAVEIVKNLHPDLVVLTGDFVTVPLYRQFHARKRAANAAEPCSPGLSRFSIRMALPVLRNRSIPIEQGGSRIWLCGLDSIWEWNPDIDHALREVPGEEPVVLLVPEPDFADEAAYYPVDFQLSGHSHGGQIWLPGIGAPWLPTLAKRYPRGLYRIGPLTLYTNVGLGTIRLPIRLNCPPEVTLFTLHSAASRPTS
jgi:predicted MPP superfamily phosphohydrolase